MGLPCGCCDIDNAVEIITAHFEAIDCIDGRVAVDVMQAMFSSLDPGGTLKKFRAFGTSHQNTAHAEDFIALEDWLNDGVPLVANVAIECLEDWYAENKPMQGKCAAVGRRLIHA